MVDLLRGQAGIDPDGAAYVFVDERDGLVEISFGELDRRARAIAARLQLELRPGDRALLVYPAGLEFISAFFGCLYANVVGVPATYPKPKRPMPRLQKIALDCDAHVALSTAQTLTTLDPDLLSADAATSQWIATDELPNELAEMWQPRSAAARDLAFLQYTSGSTSDPKGVMVSHGNLLNNLECIRRSFGLGETEEDLASATGVFWLPAYHDMGLIGGILTPLYMGGRSVLMSPTAFLQRPMRWLQAIHDYRATISGAPNFAYEYCVRRTTEEERAALDLSPWRLAFCGAEPIRAETLLRFAEAFRPAGFRMSSFYPCYGLAETTLLAAGPDYRNEPRILTVNRAALAEHRVAPAVGEPSDMTQRIVGCGAAVTDHKIVIVQPETTIECAADEVGEILVQGPSVTQGYWNCPVETEETFHAQVAGREGRFLRTGDLGFFRDGELFVTGRVKDVIIIRARNHYPQDIEQSAEEAHPAVLPGAAFAIETDEGDEQLVVVHQLDRQYREADFDEVVRAIRRAIVEQHDLDPHAIVLIRQTSLPITSSGKVQRNLCREQYLAGELKVVNAWTNPAPKRVPTKTTSVQIHDSGVSWTHAVGPPSRGGQERTTERARPSSSMSIEHPASSIQCPFPGNEPATAGPTRPSGHAASTIQQTAERIETWLLQWLIARLGLDAADISRDRPFAEFGVDSLTAVELSQELEDEFKVPLPPIVAWNYPTPATLARYLAEQTLSINDSTTAPLTNGQTAPVSPVSQFNPPTVNVDDDHVAQLLSEIENLSDAEAERLLAEEQRLR
jgi:acyl-CoA synthetase (AMP-forming)/AMP-acid ligase II/acyl carrier protein